MNSFRELSARQQQTEQLIEAELLRLKEEGFDTITGQYAARVKRRRCRKPMP
jgi:hypothetical protein